MPEFNQDLHQDRLLEKHLQGDDGELSNCCQAIILEDSDICSECGKGCVTVSEDYEQRRDEEADARYEQRRDER